jgi:hypothetical protein
MTPALARGIGALLLALFYLGQQLTLSPGQIDEGLTLNFVRQVAEGKRVFWDFIDVYGPIHYWPPAFFYLAFGKQVLGVRIWILLVKLASVVAVFRLVSECAERFDAWLAALWTTVLLGLPWQALQNAYAFLHCVPFLVVVQYLLLCEPLATRRANAVLAGVLTAITLFIKVSTGAFLLAGGLIYSFCWSTRDTRVNAPASTTESGTPGWFRWASAGLAVVCGAVFLLFVRKKIDPLFYLYFDVPLVLVLGMTLAHLRAEARRGSPSRHRMRLGLEYGGACAIAALTFFLAYFGIAGGMRHVREQSILLSELKYEHALLPLGKPGLYRGFTEYYWMQYPWLLTAAGALWAAVVRKGRGLSTYGAAWPVLRARAAGLWVFATLGIFAAYAHGLEVHILSAFLATAPPFFVFLSEIREVAASTLVAKGRARWVRWSKPVAALAAAAWLSTLAYLPRFDPFEPRAGRWTVSAHGGHSPGQNRLEHLTFLETNRVGMRDLSSQATDTEIDQAANDAAMFLDEITADGEDVFMISKNEIVTFHSFTMTPWERYRALFCYVRSGLIDRRTFDRLVPKEFIADLLRNPPRIAVVDLGDRAWLLDAFPEIAASGRMYRALRAFPTLLVMARMDRAYPVPP